MSGLAEGIFRAIPFFGITNVFGGVGVAKANTNAVVAHAKGIKDKFDKVEASGDFSCDLILGAEEVGIVLRESTHAGHSVEFAGLFPAVNGAKFSKPHREVAV